MSLEGTVINGVVVLDGSPHLPEGLRVRVDLEDEDDIGPPLPTETYEEHIALLRKSLADMDAGVPGMPLAQFAAELEKEFGVPPVSEE